MMYHFTTQAPPPHYYSECQPAVLVVVVVSADIKTITSGQVQAMFTKGLRLRR